MSLVFAGVVLLSVSSPSDAAPLSADDVVRYALSHHPDAIRADAETEAARGELRQVALLSGNPTVEGQLSVSAGGPQYAQATLPLSPLGEGWHARRALSLQIEAAEDAAHRARLVLAAEARRTWLQAATSSRKVALAEELLSLAGRLLQIAAARAAAGEASTLEVNLAKVVEAHAISGVLEARADAANLRAALSAYHPDAAEADLGEPEDCLPKAEGGPDVRSDVRSDVTSARLNTLSQRAELGQQRAAWIPPVGIGGWISGGEADHHGSSSVEVGPYIAVDLPLFDRSQGAIASARADLRVAEAEQQRLERVAEAEQRRFDALAAAARADGSRLVGVEQAARDALTSIDRGFQAGEIDLATAVLLRTQVFDGWVASLSARALAVEAELSAMLARDDEALLGGAP